MVDVKKTDVVDDDEVVFREFVECLGGGVVDLVFGD